MIDPLILAAPLLLLVMALLFLFVGCSSFEAGDTPTLYADLIKATAGFAGLWRLNEKSGNQALVSGPLAPAGHGTYTLTGVTLNQPGADPSDAAVVLDGVKGFVEVPFDVRLNPGSALSFTIELWVKPNPAVSSPTQVLISSHQNAVGRDQGYEIALIRVAADPNPKFRVRLFRGADPATELTVAPNAGAADAWRHVVMTFDGGTDRKLTLYVGVKGIANAFVDQLVPPVVSKATDTATPLRFGAGNNPSGAANNFFAGTIDEVAFYNIALAKADVEKHFQAVTPV